MGCSGDLMRPEYPPGTFLLSYKQFTLFSISEGHITSTGKCAAHLPSRSAPPGGHWRLAWGHAEGAPSLQAGRASGCRRQMDWRHHNCCAGSCYMFRLDVLLPSPPLWPLLGQQQCAECAFLLLHCTAAGEVRGRAGRCRIHESTCRTLCSLRAAQFTQWPVANFGPNFCR